MYEAKSVAADPPFSHRILDKDEASRRALRAYLKPVIASTIMISVVIWCVLGIYWGANWRVFEGIHNLSGWIIDFDGGDIGAAVQQAYLSSNGPKEKMTWFVVPAANFPNGEADIVQAVVDNKCWVAVKINSGATNRLNAAIAAGDSSYNNSEAVTIFSNEARNENAYSYFILEQLQEPILQAESMFAMQQAQKLPSSASSTLLTSAPSLVLAPLNHTIINLRPFDIQVAEAVDFVGLIYLLILSFIAAMASYQARVMMSGIERRLKFSSLMILRYVVPFTVYFWLSLVYSLLSLFFKVPFDRQFGHGGFVIYWMLSWCGMLALGLALESMITLLTARFIPFFLVLWIITNVSVVFFPIEILPTIFRYGYATPFYNVSEATRAILFRTRNQVGLNFGVLFAWIGISLVAMAVFQIYVRRRSVTEWRRQQEAMSSDSTSLA